MAGEGLTVPEAEFAFFLHQPEQLKEHERRYTLTADDLALFNPNTRTRPTFRTRRDMEVARKLYRRAGVFWREARDGEPEHNPWGAKFQTMFHMSNDSGLFRTLDELLAEGWELEGNVFRRGDERYLPLYEAKLFHQYDHRFATFEGASAKDRKNGRPRPMTEAEKRDPDSVVLPRYWVPAEEVESRLARVLPPPPPLVSLARAETGRRFSPNGLATCSPQDHERDQRENRNPGHDAGRRSGRFRDYDHRWLLAFRDIARPTDRRTAILTPIPEAAVSNKAPLVTLDRSADHEAWLQAFRGITRSTDERTLLSDNVPRSGVGNSAPVVDYGNARAVASALVLANMNSLVLDWAARLSVGGVNLNFFIVKQLPVLPPEAYLKTATCGETYLDLVVPRVLELTYTADDLRGFAEDLGYDGPPFAWNEDRRHRLRSELDAVYAHMYGLDRSELTWILDATPPSASFPSLKQHETKEFGEYRTSRYVLQAFDRMARGDSPSVAPR